MIKDLFLYPHREETEPLLNVHAKGCTENEPTLRTILVFETNCLESVQTPSFFFEMNDIRLEIAEMGNDIFTIEKPTSVTGKPTWVGEFCCLSLFSAPASFEAHPMILLACHHEHVVPPTRTKSFQRQKIQSLPLDSFCSELEEEE